MARTAARYTSETRPECVTQALRWLESKLSRRDVAFDSPQAVKDYCRLRIGACEQEVFAVLFLDSQHRLIACEEMFRGTIAQTAVYPREIVKRALSLNAGAVIISHNHPSGLAEPSRSDAYLTATLKTALAMIDVRVIDHIVVSAIETVSFAERGLI